MVHSVGASVDRGRVRDSGKMMQNQLSNQKETRAMKTHGNRDGSSDDGGDAITKGETTVRW